MKLNANKNQYLFFSHTFLREFFHGLGQLGWVYLYFQGVSLLAIFVALFFFRLLSNLVFTPLTHLALKHWTFKPIIFFGIFLQAIFLGSFYFAAQNLFFLGLTVIFMSAFDSSYHIVRTNLERLVPPPEDIANNVGLVSAVTIAAGVFGVLLTAYGLSFTPKIVFLVSFFGMLFSYAPIHFMRLTIPPPQDDGNAFRVMLCHKSTTQFFKNPVILVILAMGLVSELVSVLPIFLVNFKVTLIGVGLLHSAAAIISFVSSILVGRYENGNKNFLSIFFGGSTIALFIAFAFLPISQLGLFVLLYGVFGASWEIGICTISQRFCHQCWPCANGGVLSQWLDNTGRNLLYPVLLLLMINLSNIALVVQLMFIFSALVIGGVLMIESPARKRLAGRC